MFGKVKDPVCKKKIRKKDAAATTEQEGKLYYFCSQECRDEFEKDPKKYT